MDSFVSSQVSNKHAAVLVPLFEDASGIVRVVLTRRAATLSSHAGEVALPGGKRDDSDASDVHTALREAREELGIVNVEVLGALKPVLSKHLISVVPVVGIIPATQAFEPNPAEVAAVFDAPLRMFLESEPGVYAYKDYEYNLGGAIEYRVHSFRHGAYTIWGLTAGILIEVATTGLGRPPEFEGMPGGRSYSDIVYDGSRIAYRGEQDA